MTENANGAVTNRQWFSRLLSCSLFDYDIANDDKAKKANFLEFAMHHSRQSKHCMSLHIAHHWETLSLLLQDTTEPWKILD